MRLNDRTVTASSPILPRGKNETIFFDEDMPGFGLRLREGGSRTWVYQYWLGDRSRRVTLGKWPKLSAKQARELVDHLAAKVALGQDPAEAKFEDRARKTSFGDIAGLYLAAQATRLRPRSLVEVERHLNVHAKPLHGQPVDKLRREEVADLLTVLAANSGPVAANRVRASITAMLNWAMKAGKVEANPAAFTNKESETSRPRVLTADELRDVWAALPDGDYGTIVRLLILTGQRRTEIGDLRWSEIDAKRSKITLPAIRTKNGRAHVIPIADAVRALIAAIPQKDGRDFLFGFGNSGFAGWSKCKGRLDAAINANRKKPMLPWTIHDCRRTAATMMADIGIQPHIIEAVLNHASGHKGGIAGVYNHSEYETEKREALKLWAKHVLKLVGGMAKRGQAA
jgi:integrase